MSDPKTPVRRTPWPESVSRPVATPLQPSVVYASHSPDALDAQYERRTEGYTYAREGHPNAAVLAQKIDALEGAEGGLVTASGMASVTAVMLGLCRAGDHVVAGDQLYGRSLRMLAEDLPRLGVETTLADPTDPDAIAAAMRPETRMVLLEVVSNPTLRVCDIDAVAAIAARHGALLVIDNTFTTPRAFKPFAHGADIVIHSVTKMLAGHSDATLGYVAARDPELRGPIRDFAVTAGLTASPFDCWLAERGLHSFELRYDRAESNAATLADHIATLPGVTGVLYPQRPDHPDHATARRLLGSRGGHMVTFGIEGGRVAANALVEAAENIPFAPTLGDIGTTLSHPATSSHRALTPEARTALGIGEGTFRVSVGVEPAELLCAEFATAIAASQG
ncbi:trans-sulfuration enzyme family protein [Tranquillimonas rosea]|uniref:trans-sulfuration enzyme family protein n=1 Tax=Tranquillimonas rosea TaxID=641238 RepID=UPI003BA8E42C